MSDVAILDIEPAAVAGTTGSHSPFSWSGAIAGTLAAMAVSFIMIALGSGIGLSLASPYGSGPSATTLTVAGAVWLVMAQTFGFAAGGYLAARLRSPVPDGVAGETAFRDAAQGFVVWAIGVVIMATMVVLTSYFAANTTVQAAGNAAGAAMARGGPDSASTGAVTDYFVDLLFRPAPAAAAGGQTPAPSGATVGVSTTSQPTLPPEVRAEVTRILARDIAQGKLDDSDRSYLGQVISARTGLPPDQAEQRVTEVDTKARETVKEAADKAAKAGALFSFWTFLSLLFGGAAATLAGILGGQLRDDDRRLGATS